MATIVTRAGKGAPLTHNEVDANFTNLNTDKIQSGDTAASLTITSADINGGTIDGTVIGGSTPAAISGTTGSFSGNLTVDTNTLFVDAASNNVGIGTSSPARRFTVSAGASASVLAIQDTNTGNTATDGFQLQLSGSGDMFLWNYENASTVFGTNNTERMRIDASGNVGIGTSSPVYTLQVQAGSPIIAAQSSGANGTRLLLSAENGAVYIGNTYSASNVPIVFTTGGTSGGVERMRIDTSGNVGIGTSSPAQKLSVTGNVTISGSLSKGSGSFKIDHPVKPDTHHLVHSFIEGPQADNLYRGKVALVDGSATVNLDEAGRMTEGTFVALNGNVQCFTTNEDGWTQVRGKVEGNILTIEAQDPACTDEVSWLVIGERHDQHMIDTNWTDEQGRIITEPEKVTAS